MESWREGQGDLGLDWYEAQKASLAIMMEQQNDGNQAMNIVDSNCVLKVPLKLDPPLSLAISHRKQQLVSLYSMPNGTQSCPLGRHKSRPELALHIDHHYPSRATSRRVQPRHGSSCANHVHLLRD